MEKHVFVRKSVSFLVLFLPHRHIKLDLITTSRQKSYCLPRSFHYTFNLKLLEVLNEASLERSSRFHFQDWRVGEARNITHRFLILSLRFYDWVSSVLSYVCTEFRLYWVTSVLSSVCTELSRHRPCARTGKLKGYSIRTEVKFSNAVLAFRNHLKMVFEW